MKARVLLLATLLVSMTCSTALGNEADQKIKRIEEEAQRYFEQSSTAFDREDYDQAIEHLKQGLSVMESSGARVGDFSDSGLRVYL